MGAGVRFDLCVFIDRFQPPHRGHFAVLVAAGVHAARVVIVIAAANRGPSSRNPWSVADRIALIRAGLEPELASRVDFIEAPERTSGNPAWARTLAEQVEARGAKHVSHPPRTALIACGAEFAADFQGWARIDGPAECALSSTELRARFFGGERPDALSDRLHPATVAFLEVYRGGSEFLRLQQELLYLQKHLVQWSAAPYPPTFVTADCCLHWRGEILCIRRAGWPGRGMLAIPGGFVDPRESLLQAALRELDEEVGLRLEPGKDGVRLLHTKMFEDPDRSLRGRTFTQVIYLDASAAFDERPPAHASDDAGEIVWMKLEELPQRALEFFEDHGDIASEMQGHLAKAAI